MKRILETTLMLSLASLLAACGGGGGDNPQPPQPATYTIGGSIAGLTSPGLVLQLNGANNITVAPGAASFTSSNSLATGAAYTVTVSSQPSSQTCTVANGGGAVASANVTNVALTCTTLPTATFTIGGTISGLTSSGLVLQVNSANNLTVTSGATGFTSSNALTTGLPYAVTVLTQPATQTCAVSNGAGTVVSTNVTNVAITCTTPPPASFTVGGGISGLTASGLVLQLNGANNLTVASSATSFVFANSLTSGTAYAVAVLTQPTNQICTIANGAGTIGGANVSNVTASCVSTYSVGVTISGYTTSGLVLQLNGGNNLTAAANSNALQTFAPRLLSNAAYDVTILSQPATQQCTLGNATGTVAAADVSNVTVSCASTYSVGVTVSGLTGSGLVLQLNGGNNLTPSAGGALQLFAPRLLTNAAYAVTVLTQPSNPTQQCTVANGSGTIANANVTNVTVTCVPIVSLSGTVSGLTGTLGLNVLLSGVNAPANQTITVPPSGSSFTLPVGLREDISFRVIVATQPAGQTCLVTRGAGVTETANISGINVTCVGNLTSPLVGTYEMNGESGIAFTFNADGTYAMFYRTLDDGCINNDNQPLNGIEYGIYTWNSTTGLFKVEHAPVDQSGECGLHDTDDTIVDGATVTKSGNNLSLDSNDPTDPFATTLTAVPSTTNTLLGSFSGPNGGSLTFLGNGTFIVLTTQGRPDGAENDSTFAGLEHGCYTTTATTLTFNMSAGCVLPDARPPVDTSGNAGLVLNGQGRTVNYTVNGDTLALTVGTNTVTYERIVVNAVTPPPTPPPGTYTVGGAITGLNTNGLVLLLNNGNELGIPAGATTFTFPNALTTGTAYAVAVLSLPLTQRCSITNGGGTIASANVTNVTLACNTFGAFSLGGTITGLTGTLGLTATLGAGLQPVTITVQPGAATFALPNAITAFTTFRFTVSSQPVGQTCVVTRGAGMTAQAAITDIRVTCAAKSQSTLVGTYGLDGSLTFYADGTYVQIQNSEPNVCNGIEYGIYSWNSTTGAFHSVIAPVDTNSDCGLRDATSPNVNRPFTLTKTANSITLVSTDPNDPGTYTAPAVPSIANTVIGSFEFLSNGNFVANLGDGTFIFASTQDRPTGSNNNGIFAGYERGCYSTAGGVISIDMSVTCRPDGRAAIDTSGNNGASLNGQSRSFDYAISGDSYVTGTPPFTTQLTRINVN